MKKVLAIVLALLMVAMVFAGCAPKAPAPAETSSTDATASVETPVEEPIDISKPVTLKWYLHGSNVTDAKPVLDAANEYMKDKLNVTLEPIWGTWADFDTNSVLALQGGDKVDIYFTCSWSANEYNKFARDGYWVRLDNPDNNLLEKYGKDVWALLPEVLRNGATIEGKDGKGVYGVPGFKDIATQNCWDINVTLLEKYGYTIDDIKKTDFYGFGDIMKKVKDGEGKGFYPMLIEGAVLERMVNNTPIVTGDASTNNILSFYFDPADPSKASATYGNKIVSKYETPEYKKFAEKVYEYAQAGYIDPAMGIADTANAVRAEKQLAAQYLIGTQSYAFGYEVQASGERKINVAMVPTAAPTVDTTSSQGALMAISTASENPDRAMMFLNLLNTDAKLMTLLNFGVEGVHYNMNATGEAEFADKRADYTPWTNGMGNITLLPPQKGQGADFVAKFKDFYGNAKQLPILGFIFDQTPVTTEIGALANAAAKYTLALNTGSVDPAVELPKLIADLKANGIDKVVTEANNQLTAWAAK